MLTLRVGVDNVHVNGDDASVHLEVPLMGPVYTADGIVKNPTDTLLATGVTVPVGNTVVLGTSAMAGGKALILTVRPQLAK